MALVGKGSTGSAMDTTEALEKKRKAVATLGNSNGKEDEAAIASGSEAGSDLESTMNEKD